MKEPEESDLSKLAANLVRNCLRIRPEDNVTVFFYPHTLALAEDVATECFKVGADVLLNLYTDAYYAAYMKHLSEESLRTPSVFCKGLTELSTAEFWLGAVYDPAVFRGIPPGKMVANDEGETAAHWPLARERKIRSLFVGMGQVTRPRAKAYGFSYTAWERMMRAASSVPPARLAEDGKRLAAVLGTADRVRIAAGNGTDLSFSLKGRPVFVHDGVVDDEDIARGSYDAAIPAGDVTVAPLETSANGSVVFDLPQPWAGRTVRRLRWDFSDGRLTSWTGDAVALRLKAQWEKSGGDRDRLGFLGIGVNPKARTGFLTNNFVRGVVTIGIGGNEDQGGTNKAGFFYGQALGAATVEVDGKPVVEKGKLLLA